MPEPSASTLHLCGYKVPFTYLSILESVPVFIGPRNPLVPIDGKRYNCLIKGGVKLLVLVLNLFQTLN